MASDDVTRTPTAKDPGARGATSSGTGDATGGAARAGATGAAAHEALGASDHATLAGARPRPRRRLNLFDRLVRVPIGFLWLGVLAVLAVPVIICMTLLYYAAQWTSALFGRNRATRGDRGDREERVA